MIRLYETLGAKPISLAGHTSKVVAIAFRPGESVLSIDDAGQLRSWAPDGTATGMLQFEGKPTVVIGMKELVVVGTSDGRLIVTSGDLKMAPRELRVHASAIKNLTPGPIVNRVYSSSGGNNVVETDLAVLKPVRTLKTDGPVLDVAISSDAKHVAAIVQSGKTFVWQSDNGKQLCVCEQDKKFVARSEALRRRLQVVIRRVNHRTAQLKAAQGEVATQEKTLTTTLASLKKANDAVQTAAKKLSEHDVKIATAQKAAKAKPNDKPAQQALARPHQDAEESYRVLWKRQSDPLPPLLKTKTL